MTRVGAVDCGTNSIRLLVADAGPDGRLVDVVRRMEVVRLGYGVDRTGVIDPAAMQRTLAMSQEYAAACREHGAERVRFVATSASRDARNADEFVAGVRAAFGDYAVSPEVVSGAEEAELSFAGATGDLVAAGIPGPYLVVDLGGGSTEVVRGAAEVAAARSVDIGCVRMTERHLHGDPPTVAEIGAATADIDAGIAAAREAVGFAGVRTIVGLAGSITTVTAHLLALDVYDSRRIHLAAFSPEQHEAASTELLAMTRAQRAALPFMHPGRVDVIGAGALVWRQVLTAVLADSPEAGVVTSEHDILDGIALSIA
jgi:exopolyphosphatase/guanosine-5'-triphosphate,3'-diphosphate pyrophosphatase